ncbi:MAG: recombinase family protein [Oscillospiraceae bacterium]|nr:recombinase family protein [Oscillospiraceae bacterium]
MNKQYNTGLYLRLSVEDTANTTKRGKVNPFQNESASIENQRVLLIEYADLQGWNVTQIYIDDGYSGGSFDNRPAFQQMVRDAEAGVINLILVKDLSRLGRDYIETGRYTEDVFPSMGVRLVALMDNIDSEGNDDLLPFRSILNDYYLKDLSRKVKSVLRAKAEKGEYIGAWAPYGYIKDPTCPNRLLIDEYAAEVVRRIFEMRVQRFGFGKITANLNNDGILSPRTYTRRQAGNEKPPKVWTICVVKDIVANEAYIGNSVRFKTGYLSYKNRSVVSRSSDEWVRCDNVFPPIIRREIWEAVRNLDGNSTPTGTVVVEPSLFNGLLRCADCGSAMMHKRSSYTSRVTGQKYTGHAYICSKHAHSGGSVCSRHTIPEPALLAIIREDVKHRIESISINEKQIVREVQRHFNGESLNEAKKHLEQLTAQLNELASVVTKLYEDRFKGIITIDTFKSSVEKAEREKSDVNAEYVQLAEFISAEEHRVLEVSSIIPKLQDFLSFETITHEMLTALIEYIIVSENDGRSRYRTHKVQIVYRF